MTLNFGREIASFTDKARHEFVRERGQILAVQSTRGALRSGQTGKMIAWAANASALELAETLSKEALASALPRSKRLKIRQASIRQALLSYQAELLDLSDFSITNGLPSATATFKQILVHGQEDVRRTLQRHEDGRSGGPQPPWPLSRPVVLFWITTGVAALSAAAAVIALFKR
jgi:hypothetical protein